MDASQTPSIALLVATGQCRPLKLCGILSALGFAAVTAAPFLLYHGHNGSGFVLFAIGGALLLGGVFYTLRRTRCPACRAPWLQYALGEKSVANWLTWLVTFTECPHCGFTAAALRRAGSDLTDSQRNLRSSRQC